MRGRDICTGNSCTDKSSEGEGSSLEPPSLSGRCSVKQDFYIYVVGFYLLLLSIGMSDLLDCWTVQY